MLLENKVAVMYGAGGSIGGAVARAFTREGARVFLAGRTKEKLDKVADEIRSNDRVAETAVIDASMRRRLISMSMRWSSRPGTSISPST